jgi:thioredoxin reductase (NADPH)
VSALYPEKLIYDIAGFPAVKGRDLVGGLVEQASTFDPLYLLGNPATDLTETGEGWTISLGPERSLSCKAVVITAGIGTFSPRPLPVGEDYLGRGLEYFVPRLKEHANRDVVIVGGGDSAFDWALSLEPIARSVTLVHRRVRFRAHAHTVAMVEESSVQLRTPCVVRDVRGAATVEAVEIEDMQTGAIDTLKAQTVIAALGFTADLGPIEGWGLRIQDRKIPVAPSMATNVPGVFAAGDVTTYPGKVRLISVGFGEAATAVNNAAVFIDPQADLAPGHSSDAV